MNSPFAYPSEMVLSVCVKLKVIEQFRVGVNCVDDIVSTSVIRLKIIMVVMAKINTSIDSVNKMILHMA